MFTYEVTLNRQHPWCWRWVAIEHHHHSHGTQRHPIHHGTSPTAYTARRAATRAIKRRKKALRDDIWSDQ